jgi:hypothetical protein
VKYRFRESFFGKQILQVYRTWEESTWDGNDLHEHSILCSDWKDADREEADQVFLILCEKFPGSGKYDRITWRFSPTWLGSFFLEHRDNVNIPWDPVSRDVANEIFLNLATCNTSQTANAI